MQIILILAVTAIVGVTAAVYFGFFRAAEKKDKPQNEDEKYFSANPDGLDDPFGEMLPDLEEQDSVSGEELINLFDYYADPEPEPQEAEAAKTAHKTAETQEANFDKLCNLKVGRGYLIDCQNVLLSGLESNTSYALAHFDFSRFRFVNTLKGFSTGDYALTRISQEAAAIFPSGALISRLAADHFTVLFPCIDNEGLNDILNDLFQQLRKAADRIRADISAKQGMQICMGIALTRTPGDYDVFKLMRKANIARHCNKMAREESFSLFDDSMLSTYLFGESSVEEYKEMQYNDDFVLYLTPQLAVSSKRVSSCAAQARWPYEEVSDNPLSVEKGGMLTAGNLKVAYLMCKIMSRWRKLDSLTMPAMVSLSEIEVLKEDVDAFFARCLGEFQLDAALLTVVVSQHTIRLHPQIVLGQLEKLKNIGLKVAVGDFERDTQDLSVLGDFKPDYLKLHKSFAVGADKNPERQAEINRILSLAAGINAGTVFEGVNTAGCMGYFSTSGASFIEGRYVGAPVLADEFAKEMRELIKNTYDANTTVVLDDSTLSKGDINLF